MTNKSQVSRKVDIKVKWCHLPHFQSPKKEDHYKQILLLML